MMQEFKYSGYASSERNRKTGFQPQMLWHSVVDTGQASQVLKIVGSTPLEDCLKDQIGN